MNERVPLRVHLAITVDGWFERAISALRALHHGFWLGMLRREDIAIANLEAYARWNQFLDPAYNQSGLSDWERDAVNRYFLPGSEVLVPSAGGGRELLGLEAMGYGAVGFDPSPELVRFGRHLLERSGSGAKLVLSPPDVPPGGLEGPFQAVLIGWGGFTHIRGRSTRVEFIRRLRALVDDDAPLVVSFFLRAAEDRSFTAARRIATALHRLRRSHDSIELGDAVAATFDHYFTWDEVRSEFAEACFAVVEFSSSPYAHIVCRAV